MARAFTFDNYAIHITLNVTRFFFNVLFSAWLYYILYLYSFVALKCIISVINVGNAYYLHINVSILY